MSRTAERLIALAAIVLVSLFGYVRTEQRTCEAVNKSHRATRVFLDELIDAYGGEDQLDEENRRRVAHIRAEAELSDCGLLSLLP